MKGISKYGATGVSVRTFRKLTGDPNDTRRYGEWRGNMHKRTGKKERRGSDMEGRNIGEAIKSATKVILEVCETVCDNLCKYSETADEDSVCDYMREHEGHCPLDRLY